MAKQTHDWFSSRVRPRKEAALKILASRGAAYGDSWGNDAPHVYMQAALRIVGNKKRTPQVYRLLRLAALCDTKLGRIQSGEFLEDSSDDLSNYNDAFCAAALEVQNA